MFKEEQRLLQLLYESMDLIDELSLLKKQSKEYKQLRNIVESIETHVSQHQSIL